jgi:hypothetical protein
MQLVVWSEVTPLGLFTILAIFRLDEVAGIAAAQGAVLVNDRSRGIGRYPKITPGLR